jgi:hypothetical protein
MQALGDLASTAQGTLIRSAFALRGVSQAVAQPASEIAPAVDLPASPAALQAAEPLPTAAEHGGRVGEGDELGDVNRRPIAIRRSVDQAHAVALRSQRDRARLFSRPRPRDRGTPTRLQHAASAQPGEIHAEAALACWCTRAGSAAAKSSHGECSVLSKSYKLELAPFLGLSRRAASPQALKIARQTQRAAPQQLQIECPEPRIGSALHVLWPWRERLYEIAGAA